jgi:exosortase A-associated hydrolase 2
LKKDQFLLKRNGLNLFGMLYQPDNAIINSQTNGFIICHPFAEEKKSSQRVLVEIAQHLCEQGCVVCMFDMSGCGDSQGAFKDSSLSDWVMDIQTSISYFKEQTQLETIGLIGLRLGGYLCLVCAQQDLSINKLVLIQPTLDPHKYLKRSLRQKLIKELHTSGSVVSNRNKLFNTLEADISIDFDGYEISSHFFKDLVNNHNNLKLNFNKNLSLFEISLKDTISKEYQRLITEFEHKDKTIFYKHIKMAPFWSKIDTPNYKNLIDEVVSNCIA